MRIIKEALYINSLSLHRDPEEGAALNALATSFAYTLEDIPTHHLEACFRRAQQTSTSEWPVVAATVRKAYDAMLPDLLDIARLHANAEVLRLQAGHGSLGRMTLEEWKGLHNLPAMWKLGDAYPPESDLYSVLPPEQAEQTWRCEMCHDARYVKHYPYGRLSPELRPCPRCGF